MVRAELGGGRQGDLGNRGRGNVNLFPEPNKVIIEKELFFPVLGKQVW